MSQLRCIWNLVLHLTTIPHVQEAVRLTIFVVSSELCVIIIEV